MNELNRQAIERADQAAVLHPFTQADAFDAGKLPPYVVDGGSGVRIRGADGTELLDAFAGLYCVNVGYGRSDVAEAISRQAHRLAYYHCYSAHTTEPLARLAQRLVAMAPGSMKKAFFGLSGSDANETQAKLVWYYNNLRGMPAKKKIIARERGYHGCTVMAGSMTGMNFYHAHMDLPRDVVLHTGVPHHYRGALDGESQQAFSARRADELEQLILAEGPDTIGAFIAEPVLGTGGLIPPPDGYWPAIQAVLRKYDVLLIADEVICGFGRTGAQFGCDRYGMEPDLVTIAKGLTSGYVPMSAALVGSRVWNVIRDASAEVGPFSHGYTYSGHPLGAAAANACLDILENEDLAGNAARIGDYLVGGLRDALADHPLVAEIRGVGLLAAVEFMADREARIPFDTALKVGPRLSAAAREMGLITRAMPHGDILGFAPPLVLQPTDADQVIDVTRRAVDQVTNELSREGAL